MIRSREVIPASLEHALVANRVLAAFAANDLASQESRDAVDDGLLLLMKMLEGQRLANLRSVEAGSYQAALAYGEGVKAFELVAYQQGENDDPAVYLRELVKSASALRQEGANEKAIRELTNFFRTIREIALANAERPVERVG
jgi:hypothetical protein